MKGITMMVPKQNRVIYHLIIHRYRSLNNTFILLYIIVSCAREKIQLNHFIINPHKKHGSTATNKYDRW